MKSGEILHLAAYFGVMRALTTLYSMRKLKSISAIVCAVDATWKREKHGRRYGITQKSKKALDVDNCIHYKLYYYIMSRQIRQ